MKGETESSGRRRGRPRNEDRGYVLAHFEAQIALGRTVTEIAEAGLTFYGVGLAPDGRTIFPIARRTQRGLSLERRYRQYRAEMARSLATLHPDPLELVEPKTGLKGRRFISRIGITSGPTCLSFPARDDLKRGRPKKMRME